MIRFLLPGFLAVILLLEGGRAAAAARREQREDSMQESALAVLQTSKDPKQLAEAAFALARSDQDADHDRLLEWLKSPQSLSRLDSEEAYAGVARRLRIARVLDALSSNPAPSAKNVLVALTEVPAFIGVPACAELLISACASVRPAPPPVIKFWDEHCQPDDGFTPLTIDALAANGSAPAMALFEKKMADPKHEDDDKIGWMRSSILVHRDDVLLLRSCARMLAGVLPAELRPELIEVLFDYRPMEWYTPAAVYTPPDRSQASPEARSELRKIGELALKSIPLTPRQRKAIEDTLKGLK